MKRRYLRIAFYWAATGIITLFAAYGSQRLNPGQAAMVISGGPISALALMARAM